MKICNTYFINIYNILILSIDFNMSANTTRNKLHIIKTGGVCKGYPCKCCEQCNKYPCICCKKCKNYPCECPTLSQQSSDIIINQPDSLHNKNEQLKQQNELLMKQLAELQQTVITQQEALSNIQAESQKTLMDIQAQLKFFREFIQTYRDDETLRKAIDGYIETILRIHFSSSNTNTTKTIICNTTSKTDD